LSPNAAKRMEGHTILRQKVLSITEDMRQNPEAQKRKTELSAELSTLRESDLRKTCTI